MFHVKRQDGAAAPGGERSLSGQSHRTSREIAAPARGDTQVGAESGSVVYYLHGDHPSTGPSWLLLLLAQRCPACYTTPTERTAGTRGTLPTDYPFTGQRNETSFGLRLPVLSRGPLGLLCERRERATQPGNPQDFNRYAYVRNSPLRYTDPTGHIFRPPQRFRISLDISGWNPQVVQAQDVSRKRLG